MGVGGGLPARVVEAFKVSLPTDPDREAKQSSWHLRDPSSALLLTVNALGAQAIFEAGEWKSQGLYHP